MAQSLIAESHLQTMSGVTIETTLNCSLRDYGPVRGQGVPHSRRASQIRLAGCGKTVGQSRQEDSVRPHMLPYPY